MARHINQRAITVNSQRVNDKPQAPRQTVSRTRREQDPELSELDELDGPMLTGVNLQLLLTGQHRSGAGY